MNRIPILCLALSLVGCSSLFGGDDDEAPPPPAASSTTRPSSPPPAATAPGTPTPAVPSVPPGSSPTADSACPSIEQAILGTWAREGFVEEYRQGGVYVINGHEGTIRWLAPGRAFLDVGELHAEYHLGLTDVNELIAVDPSHIGSVYRRTSPAPSIPPSCYELRTRIVGTWVGGTYTEVYGADGSYRVNALTGTWQTPQNGRLAITTQSGTGNYYWAMLSPTSAIAFGDAMRGTIYVRQ